jgi:Rrf2 family protein
MRLTRYTDYSLRVLIYLGLQTERLSSIREIADLYGISESHLMKVVQALGQSGYVATLRGRGGGLRLAKSPHEINLGDVVRTTEERRGSGRMFCRGRGMPDHRPMPASLRAEGRAQRFFRGARSLYFG